MRVVSLGRAQEADAVVGDEVGEVVEMVDVVVFHSTSVHVHAVVVEATVADQAVPLCPSRRQVVARVLVQVLTEIPCRAEQIKEGLTSHQTHYRSYRGRVFTGQMTQPTVSKH